MPVENQLDHWKRSFPYASSLFKPFGFLLVPILGLNGYVSNQYLLFVAAGLILSIAPFTAIALARINSRLLALGPSNPMSETERLVQEWGRRHHVRTLLSVAAFVLVLLSNGQ